MASAARSRHVGKGSLARIHLLGGLGRVFDNRGAARTHLGSPSAILGGLVGRHLDRIVRLSGSRAPILLDHHRQRDLGIP